jgi:hypothetical protein
MWRRSIAGSNRPKAALRLRPLLADSAAAHRSNLHGYKMLILDGFAAFGPALLEYCLRRTIGIIGCYGHEQHSHGGGIFCIP